MPVNTTAHVVLPGRPTGLLPDGIKSVCSTSGARTPGQAAAAHGGGGSASTVAGMAGPGAYTVVVGSGHYSFKCDLGVV